VSTPRRWVPLALGVLTAGFLAAVFLRARVPTQGSSEPPKVVPSAAPVPSLSSSAAPSAPAARKLDRPLRIGALDWSSVAAAIRQNDGTRLEPSKAADDGAFTRAGVLVSIGTFAGLDAAKRALAVGGADPKGLDVLIAPLPDALGAIEPLRALELEIFLVSAWSEGGFDVAATEPFTKLVGPVALLGEGAWSSDFLARLALEVSGLDVDTSSDFDAGSADPFVWAGPHTRASSIPAGASIVLSTADASRLVPIVAVAPRALLTGEADVMARWASVWLEAEQKLAADAAGVARFVATQKGAPEPLELVARLGERTSVTRAENVEVFAAGRAGSSQLEWLVKRSWNTLRSAGRLAQPLPEKLPVDGSIVKQIARASDVVPESGPPSWSEAAVAAATPALRIPLRKGMSNAEIAPELVHWARAFPRAAFRIERFAAGISDENAGRGLLLKALELEPRLAGRLFFRRGTATPEISARFEIVIAR
jgi:hypothetical protein